MAKTLDPGAPVILADHVPALSIDVEGGGRASRWSVTAWWWPRPPVDFSRLDGCRQIALAFSGGKDSLALIYLFREHLDRITVLHVDTGDRLPEAVPMVEWVEKSVPHFVRMTTNSPVWIAANAIPSELVPLRAHPITRTAVDPVRRSVVPSFDCCLINRWQPLERWCEQHSVDLVINGERRADSVSAMFWRWSADTRCSMINMAQYVRR